MIHNNEIVSIEEVLLKPPYLRCLTRQFLFANRTINLKLRIISIGATIDSIKLNDHEIVVVNENGNGNHLEWDSHVFGFDALQLRSLSPPFAELSYQLSKNNELYVEGKGFINENWAVNPIFLNLNLVDDKPSLEGHCLCIRASNESINIFTEPNMGANGFAQFISDVPLSISDYLEGMNILYSTNQSCTADSYIIASLRYEDRRVDILLEISQWYASHLLLKIKNGSIAFIPHNMSKFKLTYRFYF
ncbi:hypothetical protein RDWZM_008068 [Blomia tropicalis]|uniref:Uncharacterized protein n=1 Tax=Blomia tropicalis TaxID=40697 RepID=A0A9Q0RL23_BLOTA|nr:hypothetical protein BLOT_003754 [Blomia tropicalis]KAJ6216911.1 hypothetical protein RDWZM_008068 [Blomia tropicalis]